MKNRALRLCLFVAIATIAVSTAFADGLDSPYLPGHLNFVVNEQLVIQAASSEGMEFAAKKELILGKHLMERLPLSQHDGNKIEQRFEEARRTGTSQTVHYWLDMFAMRPDMGIAHSTKRYFEANITPLSDANGSTMFFVRVREVKLLCPEDL